MPPWARQLKWDDNEFETEIWMAPADGGEAFRYIGEEGGSDFQFSPDGRYLTFKRSVGAGDKRTQQAVIMSLVIIGEAATKLMDRYSGFTDRHAEIPWRSMRGMRNRVAHGYFEIDVEMVWETVQTALPDLLDKLDGIPELPGKEDDSNSV